MAYVGDILTIWGNISKVMSIVVDLQENSSVLSEEFRDEVDILCNILKLYEDQIHNIHSPSLQKTVVGILSKAQNILNGATPRLLNLQEVQKNIDNSCGCCSYGWWLYAKMSLVIFFPEKLEKTLKKVTDEINRIHTFLKQHQELTTLTAWPGANPKTIYTTFYDNNSFYVPIEDSHGAVIRAIDNLSGPRIILLHGGVGKGKSTLARYVCAHYGEQGENKDMFKHVILVLCGGNRSKLIPSTKQFEILQFLSSRSSGTSSDNRGTSQLERIEEDLQKFMRDEKILIILDDVADPEFLYEMWKVSQGCRHVKYLVTSQKSDLCWRVAIDSWPVEMGEPTMEEARKIVASLVGLEHKTIPPELKEVADAMIEATGRNPLALACLISKFTKGGHRTDRKAWVEALQRLNELLGEQENIGVYGLSHTSRGVWAAIELCLKSMESAEARDILSLMYACKGDSIPEEVLSIWYHMVPTTSTIFSFSMDELSMRELLKSVPGTWNKMRTWSLRPLLKLYMDRDVFPKEKMGPLLAALIGDNQQEMKSRFGKWLGGNRAGPDAGVKKERLRLGSDSEEVESEKTRVATVLCALYFDSAHTNKVVADVANRARSLIKDPNDPINDLRRKAIEPIIWLMDKSEEQDGTWTKAHISCARQIFLKYVCEQQLDEKSICVLLELTSSYPLASWATFTALSDIFRIEKKFLPIGGQLQKNYLPIGGQLRFRTLIAEILKSSELVERREVEQAAFFAFHDFYFS